MTRETLASVKEHMARMAIDNAENVGVLQAEIRELTATVRHQHSDIKELKQQVDVARANELGHKLDVARLGGMLDAYRDAGMIPSGGYERIGEIERYTPPHRTWGQK